MALSSDCPEEAECRAQSASQGQAVVRSKTEPAPKAGNGGDSTEGGSVAVFGPPLAIGESVELSINGLGGNLCMVLARRTWTVGDLKEAVEIAAKVPARQQRLFAGVTELLGNQLLDGQFSADVGDVTLVQRPVQQAEWLDRAMQDWSGLLEAPEAAWADREVVLAAVGQCGWALEHAATELRADREVVLAAVRQNGLALQHACEELRVDQVVALAAVVQCGRALVHAAAELQADRAFVLMAVEHNWRALEHTRSQFREDREVVLAAVAQSGTALSSAAAKLKSDYGVVIFAVERDRKALSFAANALRKDPDLRALAEAAPRRNSV